MAFENVDYTILLPILAVAMFMASVIYNTMLDLVWGPKASTEKVTEMLLDRTPGSPVAMLKNELIEEFTENIDTATIASGMLSDVVTDLDKGDGSKLRPEIDKIAEKISRRAGGYMKNFIGKVPDILKGESEEDMDKIALLYMEKHGFPGMERIIGMLGYDLHEPGAPSKLLAYGVRLKLVREEDIQAFVLGDEAPKSGSSSAEGGYQIQYG